MFSSQRFVSRTLDCFQAEVYPVAACLRTSRQTQTGVELTSIALGSATASVREVGGAMESLWGGYLEGAARVIVSATMAPPLPPNSSRS